MLLYMKVHYIHIGVGFEVAYLYRGGKFEGQEREISNEYESHAFFVSCVNPCA